MVPVRDRDRSTFSSAPGRPGDGLRAPGSRWSVHEPTPRALPPGSPPGRPRPDPRRRVDRGGVERLRAVRGDGHGGTGFDAVRRPGDPARRPDGAEAATADALNPWLVPIAEPAEPIHVPVRPGDVVDQQGQERVEGQAVRWVRRVGWRFERRQLRRQEPDVVPGARHQPLGLLLLRARTTSYPGNVVYRWGCAGSNNVYLFAHAHSAFKPLHDAYVNGRLRKGMKVSTPTARARSARTS